MEGQCSKPKTGPGSKYGAWYNPKKKETLRADLDHPAPIQSHWDFMNAQRKEARLFKDGTYEWLSESETKRILYKYDFDYETVASYFKDHIEYGNTLSTAVLNKINFRLGKFYTYLPENIRLHWLHNFSSGIMLSSESNKVLTTTLETSEMINKFLQEKEGNCAIVEDCMVDAHEYENNIENVKMAPYKNETYYYLTKNNLLEELCPAIKGTGVWHTLIVLTNLEEGDKIVSLNDELINKACDNAKYVIARIYDGEAYIFWERPFDPQTLKLN